jgi:hypothetical protein
MIALKVIGQTPAMTAVAERLHELDGASAAITLGLQRLLANRRYAQQQPG